MAFSFALGGSIYRTRWLYHPHRWLNLFAILSLFLKYSFASPKVKKYIRNASTGTSLKHFVLKPANALPISYPDLIEQEKIGSLLMLKRQVKHLLLNKQENQQLSF